MFTGLVEGVAKISLLKHYSSGGGALVLTKPPFAVAELELGESVAVNGCCLTVAAIEEEEVRFELLEETWQVTNFSTLQEGGFVNVERALAVGERLGGHLVQGHVDGLVRVEEFALQPSGDWQLRVQIRTEDLAQVLERGSITLNGISLTAALVDDEIACVSCFIVAHTKEVTNLSTVKKGDFLNVEFDLLGKFVRRAQQLNVNF